MPTPLDDLNEAIEAAKKVRLGLWSKVSIFLVAFVAYFVFDHFGRTDLGLPILNFIFVICISIFVKWKLRNYMWFWITMSTIVILHVPLFFWIPWTKAWIPALVITAVDTVDFCLILLVVSLIGRLVDGFNRKSGAA